MGSIGGGGRYDDLTAGFGMKNMSGVGISFGFDRIYLVMEELDLFPASVQNQTQVLFLNFGEATALKANQLIAILRDNGIRSEFYPDLLGEEELSRDQVMLKNMESGEQDVQPLSTLSKILLKKLA